MSVAYRHWAAGFSNLPNLQTDISRVAKEPILLTEIDRQKQYPSIGTSTTVKTSPEDVA
jgi:hypothetical protein